MNHYHREARRVIKVSCLGCRTLDYCLAFLEANASNATFFGANDDAEALSKARAFYRSRAKKNGFELWEGSRLVHREPPEGAN